MATNNAISVGESVVDADDDDDNDDDDDEEDDEDGEDDNDDGDDDNGDFDLTDDGVCRGVDGDDRGEKEWSFTTGPKIIVFKSLCNKSLSDIK